MMIPKMFANKKYLIKLTKLFTSQSISKNFKNIMKQFQRFPGIFKFLRNKIHRISLVSLKNAEEFTEKSNTMIRNKRKTHTWKKFAILIIYLV